MSRHRTFSVLLLALVLVGATAAAATDIPLQNWTVPSTSGKGRSALSDIGGTTTPFIPVTPCRIADTRDGSFPANFGPPSLVGGAVSRTFTIPAGPCTGIPALASAYSLNFTVVSPPTTPPGGYLTVWPTGAPKPVVSTLNFGASSILANAAIVPAGTSGGINVFVNFSTDLIIDINGYYTIFMNANEQFAQVASIGNAAAIVGYNYSNINGSHGVGGYAGGTGIVHGVQGQIGTAAAAGSSGVHGIGASVVAGKSYAVLGETADTTSDSAAVQGKITGTGAAQGIGTGFIPAGIRGDGANIGILGLSNTIGVAGRSYTAAAVISGTGYLGYNNGATTYGVYGTPGTSGTTNWAVYAQGNMGASGAKPFVEPHPSRPGMVIRYVALEGPEAGTYFRGRGRFAGRQAIIEVPEDFRLVTDVEGLSIQVTPIGEFSQVAVVSVGLDFIELKSSRDVEFFYHVNGVRRTFRDWKVMVPGTEFMPDGPSAKMPAGLSDEQKRNLIRNGTYNEDGTVNMSTARRLGWDVEWSRRQMEELGTRKAIADN